MASPAAESPTPPPPPKSEAPEPPKPPKAQEREPNETELLDILYEILADETGEDYGVDTKTVEGFLHEHARSKGGHDGLIKFFEEHGLSTRLSDYGRDPALSTVPSGLHSAVLSPATAATDSATRLRAETPWEPPAGSDEPEELESEPTPSVGRAHAAPVPAPAPSQAPRHNWLLPVLITLGVLIGVIGAVAAFATLTERELERELSLSQLQLRATGEAVDALRDQAQALRSQLDEERAAQQALEGQVEALVAAEQARREQEEAEHAKRRGHRRVRRAPAVPAQPAPAADAPASGASGTGIIE